MNKQANELVKENDLILLTIKRLGINGEGIGILSDWLFLLPMHFQKKW